MTRLSLSGRGPRDAFVFDPHRLAFSCWALALRGATPALLVSLDRHFDLVPPLEVSGIPDASAPLVELDGFARWKLDVRNYDHILAAIEAGIVGDAIIVARSKPRGSLEGNEYVDRRGGRHRILRVPNVDRIAESFGSSNASPDAAGASALIEAASSVALDIDLDCFTTASDADPDEVVCWSRELIRRALLPRGSAAFWEALLAKTRLLTVACEPLHCGGLVASNRLFEELAQVLFVELLGTDLP